MINLKLYRKILNPKKTIGELYWEDNLECNTLEDTDRFLENGTSEKIPGETAIPRGHYKIIIDESKRFKRDMPHILNVPFFEGIRIHSGNTEADTEGCILVGEYVNPDNTLANSRKAFDKLFKKMILAIKNGEEIEIEII